MHLSPPSYNFCSVYWVLDDGTDWRLIKFDHQNGRLLKSQTVSSHLVQGMKAQEAQAAILPVLQILVAVLKAQIAAFMAFKQQHAAWLFHEGTSTSKVKKSQQSHLEGKDCIAKRISPRSLQHGIQDEAIFKKINLPSTNSSDFHCTSLPSFLKLEKAAAVAERRHCMIMRVW